MVVCTEWGKNALYMFSGSLSRIALRTVSLKSKDSNRILPMVFWEREEI